MQNLSHEVNAKNITSLKKLERKIYIQAIRDAASYQIPVKLIATMTKYDIPNPRTEQEYTINLEDATNQKNENI